MPRLVKTVTEMEGRFEEKWVLVDEATSSRPGPPDAELARRRQARRRGRTGRAGVRGGARYTVDVTLPGMLHAAVLRSPLAHGRVRALDLDAARAVPGVRAVLGPDTELSASRCGCRPLGAEPRYAGAPIAVVAADTRAAAAAGVARARARPRAAAARRRRRRGDARPAPRRRPVRGRPRRRRGGAGRRRRARRGRGRDAGPAADAARAARRRRLVGRRRAHSCWLLDAGHLRLPATSSPGASGCRWSASASIAEYIGGGFGGKQGAGFEAPDGRRARRASPAVRCGSSNDRHARAARRRLPRARRGRRSASARAATARSPRSTPRRVVAMRLRAAGEPSPRRR